MQRLTPDTVNQLPATVRRPAYDPAQVKPGILHLGAGAFHRAHQAVFTDTALGLSGGHWGIIGASLRSDAAALQLNPQRGLYTLHCEDAHGSSLRLIGALQRIIVAPQDPLALDAVIADPAIKVITLTITEKGYCLGADGWSLDLDSADVRHDISCPEAATTAIGILAHGLRLRHVRNGAPLSIISCDNLSENSRRLHRVLATYMERTCPAMLSWLEQSVSFPCSMVDRIVPAASEASLARQADLLGLRDEAAIVTEPFIQWIIEDRFANDIPDWAGAGVQLVPDIRGYETIKLRILNASHSAIAYAGLLMDRETVAESMADPRLRDYVHALMTRELAPTQQAPAGFDLSSYCTQLLERYANPLLHHRCAQIAMDGTEKIRQRWLPTLEQLPGSSLLLNTLALWCHLVLETDIDVDDPRSDRLKSLRASRAALPERLGKLLACLQIDTAGQPQWRERIPQIEACFRQIERGGIHSLLSIN